MLGLDSAGSGWVLITSCWEHSTEHLGFIKGKGFLQQLNNCQILKDSASWN
jgi:hypothetical protein